MLQNTDDKLSRNTGKGKKTEDLKAYPREFYKTFGPFLSEQEADYGYLHGYLHTRNDRF